MLKSGDLELASIKLSDTQVHRYGDSAVLTGAAAQTGAFQGQPAAPKILFTAMLVFGRWEVASGRSASDCRALLTDSARDVGLDERSKPARPLPCRPAEGVR
jgi:hypothetical protein